VFDDKFDDIIGEVKKVMEEFPKKVTKVESIDVEDGITESNKKVTILTVYAHVPVGAKNIEKDFNSDNSFRLGLDKSLNDKNMDSYYGLNNENLVESQAQTSAQKTESDNWSINNWYVIFAICVGLLLIIGLIVLAASASASRKKQKVILQEKKLAYSKV